MKYLSVDEIRKLEEEAIRKGMTVEKMMDNAGKLSAEFITKNITFTKVVFIAGTGNNGGDVISTAFHLFNIKQNDSKIFILGKEDELNDGSRAFLNLINDIRTISISFIDDTSKLDSLSTGVKDADLLVVGIFGTGFHGSLPEIPGKVVDMVNESNAKKISLDIPSGINCDTGEFEKTVKSDFTFSMLCMKKAFQNQKVIEMCGHIEVFDILK